MRRGKQSATNPLLPAKLQRSFLWTLVQRTAHSHQLPQEVLTCESFAVQHTWGQGHPSVCVRQLTVSEEFQIDYLLSAGALKGRSIMLKPKEELKKNKNKKKNKKNFIAPTYIQGRKFYIKFLWFKGRSQTTDPSSSWSEVKARSAKRNQQLM